MNLKLRVDDFPGTKKHDFYKHGLDSLKKFDEIVTEFFSEYLLGVIPSKLKNQDIEWLKNNKHIKIAMHGVYHDETKKFEFDGKSKEMIENDLVIGKLALLKIRDEIIDYIPPHNAVRDETLEVLEKLGFKTVYGGPGNDDEFWSKTKYKFKNLNFYYSKWPELYGRSDELLNGQTVICNNKKIDIKPGFDYVCNMLKQAKDLHYHLFFPGFDSVWLTIHLPWERNLEFKTLKPYLERLFNETEGLR